MLRSQATVAAGAATLVLTVAGPNFKFELPAPGQPGATIETAPTPAGTLVRGLR